MKRVLILASFLLILQGNLFAEKEPMVVDGIESVSTTMDTGSSEAESPVAKWSFHYQWSGNFDKGYGFSQFSIEAEELRMFSKTFRFDFYAFSEPDGNKSDYLQFGAGMFHDIWKKGVFTLETGAFLSVDESGAESFMPAIHPQIKIWKFSASAFFLRYIVLDKGMTARTFIFPGKIYYQITPGIKAGIFCVYSKVDGSGSDHFQGGPSYEFRFSDWRIRTHYVVCTPGGNRKNIWIHLTYYW